MRLLCTLPLSAFKRHVLIEIAAVFFATVKFFETLSESRTVTSQSLHDVSSMHAACVRPLSHLAAGILR